MSHIKRNLNASGIVLLSLGALLFGYYDRTRQDLGQFSFAETADSGPVVAQAKGLVASDAPRLPEATYFESLAQLLKSKFVDPVTDDKKLVFGAIRGMVSSLNDPNSAYMDPEEFHSFTDARAGRYEGIGADMVLTSDSKAPAGSIGIDTENDSEVDSSGSVHIPRLVAAYVVPGGPADRAGVKAGDWVDGVDSKWVINSEPLRRLMQLQNLVQQGKAGVTEYNRLRQELRLKSRASMLPTRAKDRLTMGSSGKVTVRWMRGKTLLTTEIQKGTCAVQNTIDSTGDGPLRIRFIPGEAARLRRLAASKSQFVLDLRGNVAGDFASMKQCIAALAPAGSYGFVEREHGTKETPLMIEEGNRRGPKLTLLVDSWTRNAAEVFALALSAKGIAKLTGTAMAGDRSITEVVALPGGAGYTLVTGRFSVARSVGGAHHGKHTAMASDDAGMGRALDGERVAFVGETKGRRA